MVKTYGTLYREARGALLPTEGIQAGNVARQLLSIAAEMTPEAVIANQELYAAQEVCEKMDNFTSRAAAGEPLPYILGEWDFYGMSLTVTPDVLIPRDDTMVVTDLAIERKVLLGHTPRILDLCTGSGCIGLAIAKHIPEARVTLGDISAKALRVAKTNISRQKLGGRVVALQIDALAPATRFLGVFDMIVSNPPYITTEEMKSLQPSVRDFEPHLALEGGEDGLDFYRSIIQNYTPALRSGGYLCFEFGMGQEAAVGALLQKNGYSILEFRKDTSDIIRAVVAQKKEVETDGTEKTGI